jgi:hypothetical protein
MQLLTLDIICRRWLLEKGLPVHYYLEALLHGSAAIRELAKDTLKIVNTKNLPVNSYGAMDLPDDFKDDVGVFFDMGSTLKPIPHKETLNPIRRYNETTSQFEVPMIETNGTTFNGVNFFGSSNFLWFWNINEYGEPTGRYFGAGGGTTLGYKVILERRQIQLSAGFENGNMILQYVSNGQGVDNATQIEWDAFRAIQSYIDWQRSPNAAFKDSPEARTYYNEKRLLRSNLNEMNITDIRNVLHNSYMATIKN